MIRPQYHFRPGPHGLRAWNVARLIRLAEELPVNDVALSEISEIDEFYWGNDPMKVRQVAEHAKLVVEADLALPILLCAEGRVMDGMHRIAKAWMVGRDAVPARRFELTPQPDFEDAEPERLGYDPADFVI